MQVVINDSSRGSTNCFWLCPRLWSSVFRGRLHSSGRHILSGQTSVRLNVEMVVPRTRSWSPELSRCSTSHLECPSNLYLRSASISRGHLRAELKIHLFNRAYDILWEHFCFKSIHILHLLTYLLAAERRMSGSRAWKNTVERDRSGERGLQKKVWAVSGNFQLVEVVQRRATKLVQGMEGLHFDDRLKCLNFEVWSVWCDWK